MNLPIRYIALLSACALVTRPLVGQGTGSGSVSDSAARLKAVQVTETRAAGAASGASAVVISTEKLRASPAPALDQALRETPFLQVRQNSRGESELSVRGSDSRQAAVMLDGVPMTLGWDNRTDVSLIPITGAEEIVVIRGLGSLLGGPNALGGTISVSQRSGALPPGTSRTWGGLGFDEYRALVASLGGLRSFAAGGGSMVVRAGAARRQRDGFALPSGATDPTARDGLRTNSDLEETDGFLGLRWNGRAGRNLGLTISGFTADKGVPPEEHIVGPRLWRYPYHNRVVAALSGGTGAVDTPWGIGTGEISIGYNGGRSKIQSFTDRTYTTATAEELGDERTLTARTAITHSLPHEAKLGAALTIADVRYVEALPPIAGVRYRQTLMSAAAEVDVPFGAQTTFGTGIAYDRSSTPESGGRERFAPFDDLGFRAGIQREVNAQWRLHASASQRARFPALRELYSGALNRFRPNPDLKPERLRGMEAGITYRGPLAAVPDATLQATAFTQRLDDAVVRVTLFNPTRFMRVNRDRLESRGVEIIGGLAFGADRERAVTVDGDATIQGIHLFDQTAGNLERHAENNPEFRINGSLAVPLPRHLRGTLTARHSGAQYCLNPDSGGEITMQSQTLSDLSIEREFALALTGPVRKLLTVFALDNVRNSTAYDQCGLPQPGRTLRLMLTFR